MDVTLYFSCRLGMGVCCTDTQTNLNNRCVGFGLLYDWDISLLVGDSNISKKENLNGKIGKR